MAQPDDTEGGARELTFVSETIGGTRTFAIVVIVLGVVVILFGFSQPGMVWYILGGGVMVGLGILSRMAVAGGYPRLRISGNAMWLQNRWNATKPLDLAELGYAHVFEVTRSQGYQPTRELHLGFLRREEEQALKESGKAVPRDRSAFYKSLPLGTLIPFNRERAEAIAEIVNARRPEGVPVLTNSERKALVSRVSDRRWFFALASAAVIGLLILVVFILRAAG